MVTLRFIFITDTNSNNKINIITPLYATFIFIDIRAKAYIWFCQCKKTHLNIKNLTYFLTNKILNV